MSMTEVMPVYNVGGQGDGLGFGNASGGGIWIWFLFILLLFNGNGFGGLGNRGAESAVNTDFQFSNLGGKIDQVSGLTYGLSKDIYNGFAQNSLAMSQGFAGVNNAISSLGYEMASCCCETNRNIDSVRYENAKNTCDIINAGNLNTRDLIAQNTANTQAILDKLNSAEIQSLRDRVTAYEIQLSNQAQTAAIVSQVRPYPVPSYPVCPPMPPFAPVQA